MLVVGGSGSLLGAVVGALAAQRDLLLLLRRDEHRRRRRLAPDGPVGNGRDRARRADGGRAHPPAERHHRRPRVLLATAASPRGRSRESEGDDMRFSIYSELQSWPGKSYDRLYGEVLEQIENADRLGYDAYAAIEHFFFPKFSASANPFGLFGMAAARTRRINFRTMLHVLPYHNPLVLAAMIHEFSLLDRRPLRVRRRPRPRLDPAARRDAARRDLAAALRGGARPVRRGAAVRRRQPRGRVLEREGQPGDPVQRAQVPRRARRHLRPHVRPRGEARLGGRGAAAAAVRRAQGAARPLPREVRRVRHDARHHLDPRLLHRRRRATSRGARPSSTCPASSRATPRR